MLLGHLRISPYPRDGLFPFLFSDVPIDLSKCISMVSFGNRRRANGSGFYDYSARYGAVHEEDRVTLRQSMFPETLPPVMPTEIRDIAESRPEAPVQDLAKMKLFSELADKFGLNSFLDLPLIALSNGQTRRARIIKAILSKPELLLLDEPLSVYLYLLDRSSRSLMVYSMPCSWFRCAISTYSP